MTMRPGLRQLALTAHVSTSVGWLGAVAASLALAVAGLVGDDLETVRGAYLNLELVGWYVLVPLSFASLLTGLVSSLGTSWGLFRHYWVVAKLVINGFATTILLMYMESLEHLADLAAQLPVSAELRTLRDPSPLLHAGAAMALLLVATVLGVYKPRGLTPYGWRKQQARRDALAPQA